MSDDPPEDPANDQGDELRADVRQIMTADGKSQAAIAREAGINGATFSAWLNGTYLGRNDKVAADVRKWLDSRKSAERTRGNFASVPGFALTPSAQRFWTLLEHAQYMPDMVVLDGHPGIGKTMACREYAARNPHVYMVTAEPAWSAPAMILRRLAQAMAITEKNGSGRLSQAITDRLRPIEALLIIDEANHLSTLTIDQLRTYHDLANVGLALVGNGTVYARLKGEGRKPEFSQLSRRVGQRISELHPRAADVSMLLDKWGIEAEAARELLSMIARQPGALGTMTKVLRLARMTSGGKPVVANDIKLAWRQIGATELTTKAA